MSNGDKLYLYEHLLHSIDIDAKKASEELFRAFTELGQKDHWPDMKEVMKDLASAQAIVIRIRNYSDLCNRDLSKYGKSE